jgi:hypothetical protein
MSTKSIVLSMLAGAGLLAGLAFAQEEESAVPQAACSTITSTGAAKAGQVAVFSAACAVQGAAKAGIGTAKPHSPFEVAGQIGTTNVNSVTITNTGIAGPSGRAAVDFNTYTSSGGTYNPSGRFTAVDDGQFGNGFEWLSNLPVTQGGGSVNSGLFSLMMLNSQGTTGGGPSLVITQGVGAALSDGWMTYSSRRLKTNIQTIDGALEKVEQLRGVSYDRKDSGHHEIGVVAEEVAEVLPEIVARDPRTQEVQGVDYTRLTALLIEAVKQQQNTIQQLKMQVDQLSANTTR